MISIKSFIISILAALGLASEPQIQEAESQENSVQTQRPKTTMLANDYEKKQDSKKIIDVNPVLNTSIIPSDLERTKMFSESFCGPLQALLFAGIKESNHIKIAEALSRGADINKPTNCWHPLDEAIEQGISENHDHIIEFLLNRGAIVSQNQIDRLQAKYLLFQANIANDFTKTDLTLGPVATAAQKAAQVNFLNDQLRKNQAQCVNIANLLNMELKKQNRAQNTPCANRPSSLSAAAAASINSKHAAVEKK